MSDHPPTLNEALAAASAASDAYERILRESPQDEAAVSGRDHRLRVAADGMRMALAALLDVHARDAAGPRRWLYGLTADEWLHLASDDDSEVPSCCGNLGELRDDLRYLLQFQSGHALAAGQHALFIVRLDDGRHSLDDRDRYPLLNRVLDGVRTQLAAELGQAGTAEGPDRAETR